MTWEAAMRWALIRAADTGMRYRVYGYQVGGWATDEVGERWAYAAGVAIDGRRYGRRCLHCSATSQEMQAHMIDYHREMAR